MIENGNTDDRREDAAGKGKSRDEAIESKGAVATEGAKAADTKKRKPFVAMMRTGAQNTNKIFTETAAEVVMAPVVVTKTVTTKASDALAHTITGRVGDSDGGELKEDKNSSAISEHSKFETESEKSAPPSATDSEVTVPTSNAQGRDNDPSEKAQQKPEFQTGRVTEDALESKNSGQHCRICDVNRSMMTITLGPAVEFLVRDRTLLFMALLSATFLTYRNSQSVFSNEIPATVASSWMLFAFFFGQKWALKMERSVGQTSVEKEKAKSARVDKTALVISEPQISPDMAKEKDHSMFELAMKKFTNFNVHFKTEKEKALNFWSSLSDSDGHTKRSWEKNIHAPTNDALMKRLLKNETYRRKSKGRSSGNVRGTAKAEESSEQPKRSLAHSSESTDSLGVVDFKDSDAESLLGEVIDPHFRLRGMDVFLTDNPEEQIWKRPVLTKCGLRDKPTFLVNIMAPWANLCIYFEMPEWVRRLDKIVEQEDDPEDTKALKRFLSGDDEYRNKRFKVLPSLVDAPLPIRMIAPAKSEVTIQGSMLPLSWYEKRESMTHDRRKHKKALLEVDCDITSNKTIRKVTSMVRRYINKITIDVALVIGKPDDQKEDEPSACLGLLRFDKVDLETCAILPQKTDKDWADEASVIISSLSVPQLVEVAEG